VWKNIKVPYKLIEDTVYMIKSSVLWIVDIKEYFIGS